MTVPDPTQDDFDVRCVLAAQGWTISRFFGYDEEGVPCVRWTSQTGEEYEGISDWEQRGWLPDIPEILRDKIAREFPPPRDLRGRNGIWTDPEGPIRFPSKERDA